ncbi:unnamed protein product [Ascophyllum nodosum]
MRFSKFIGPAVAVPLLVVLMLVFTNEAEGCSCMPGLTLCDHFWYADVVIRAKAIERTEGSSTNDDVVYLVKTLEVLKGEVEENYVDGTMKLSLTTGGNSALCGIFMEIGEEYLIDLFHDDFSEDELTVVGSCGLFSSVDTSDSEQNNLLAGGCDDHDPCGGTCDDFQDCLVSFDFYYTGATFYCADKCDPSPCAEDEVCGLVYSTCSDKESSCPPIATCYPIVDNCNGECGEFQDCLLYAEGSADEEYYCADSCSPSPCEDGQVCLLQEVQCIRAPCPPFSACSDEDLCLGACGEFEECALDDFEPDNPIYYCKDVCEPSPCAKDEVCELSEIVCAGPPSLCSPSATCTAIDPCDGTCGEFQDCLLYAEGSADEEYYCADSCFPSPCEDGQVCLLQEVQCFRAPCPPFSACSDEDLCLGACGEFEECIQYTGDGEFYCSAVCADGACGEGETCKTRKSGWCRYSDYEGCPRKFNCTI